LGSFRKNGRLSPFLFWRLSKAHTWSATVLVDELDASGFERMTNDVQRCTPRLARARLELMHCHNADTGRVS
jgi:hypothetical protein